MRTTTTARLYQSQRMLTLTVRGPMCSRVCLRADGKDIKALNLILSGDPDEVNETDPPKGLKTEK